MFLFYVLQLMDVSIECKLWTTDFTKNEVMVD